MSTEQDKTLAALQYAIQMEIDGKEYYLKASEAASNETGKKLTVQDWVCVMTAALTHDLGHPSFSHTWEEVVKGMAGRNPTKYGHFKGWNHEKASTLLVEQLW